MNFSKNNINEAFKNIELFKKPTEIHKLSKLNNLLNGVEIYVKREDNQGLGLGGNKLRKLEFLLADAISKNADIIITSGALQSNHARLTAIACSKLGLNCELILSQSVPKTESEYQENGNQLINRILGVEMHIVNQNEDRELILNNRIEHHKSTGKKPYIIPPGGSSAIGCMGYASCFYEIIQQCEDNNLFFDFIICANGTGGTHSGLLAGKKAHNKTNIQIMSYSVLNKKEDAKESTFQKTFETLKLIDKNILLDKNEILIDDNFLGEGYGIPTHNMKEAVKLLAKTEGLFLDPVYSGKAFGGILNDIKNEKFKKKTKILFIMTGGIPGIFAYNSVF